MMLVDTRASFLDSKGNPLSAGRLVFYKADNTTPLVGYADAAFSIPLALAYSWY